MNGKCRVCSSDKLQPIHDFGDIPLADILNVTQEASAPTSPLSTSFCTQCYLYQISETVQPDRLFKYNYPYYSSQIPEVAQHFLDYYKEIQQDYLVKDGDVILEVAGNDGVLLRHFFKHTSYAYSIEPSISQAIVSKSIGIYTVNDFFSYSLVHKIMNSLCA